MNKKVIPLIAVFITLFLGCTITPFISKAQSVKSNLEIPSDWVEEDYSVVFSEDNGANIFSFDELGIVFCENGTALLDKKKIATVINEMNQTRDKDIYPYLMMEDGKVKISDYISSKQLSESEIIKYLEQNIKREDIYIYNKNFYKTAGLTPKKMYENLENYLNNFEMEHSVCADDVQISIFDFPEYFVVHKDKIEITIDDTNENEFKKAVETLAKERLKKFDSYYEPWKFHTSTNEDIEILTDPAAYGEGTYGSKVNWEDTIENLCNVLRYGNSSLENTEVIIYETLNGFEIGNTYIEVNIEEQHVWYYRDGEMLMDSNCITGILNSHDTPHGVYQVYLKAKNAQLTPTAFSYNWMRFTGRGHGLHDATWRNEKTFVPETYKLHGSHGCVNLPLDFATNLYDIIEVGTIVVVY